MPKCSPYFKLVWPWASVTRIFFIIWLLTIVHFCPKFIIFCRSRFKILSNTRYPLKSLLKDFESLPKWRNFAKSGNTALGVDIVVLYFQIFAHLLLENVIIVIIFIGSSFSFLQKLGNLIQTNSVTRFGKILSL